MPKIGSILFFVIFFLMIVVQAATQVQSSVDRDEMNLGDSFTLTISVGSTEDVDIQEPRLPNMSEFELLNNWVSTAVSQKLVQTSKGMEFETQRRKDFHYMLSPRKTGTYSVSSAEVVVNGKAYRTQPVVINVDKNPAGRSGTQRNLPRMPRGFDDDLDNAEDEIFNQLLQQRQRMLQQLQQGFPPSMPEPHGGGPSIGMKNPAYKSLPTNNNEAFFITLELDKTEVYEGEQVTVNWYVYTRGQMETFDRLKFPDLKGFWKEIIEEVPSIQFTEEIVNGVPWKKALLASHALFPIKAGIAVVDEYKVRSRVRLIEQMFGYGGKPYEYTKTSPRVTIKVKPLPIDGRPSDFTGAVGQFEVNASVEKQTVNMNEPFSLKVRFEGTGNAKLIELPAMDLSNQLEQYDTKSESKFYKNARSFKEFEVLLIPRQEGEIKIPELSVSMFDPVTAKYYTKKTQALVIKVSNNPNAPANTSQQLAVSNDPSKTAKSAENKLPDLVMSWQPSAQTRVLSGPWFWIVLFGGILAGLGLKARREFGWGMRRRTLDELIQKRLKVLDQAVTQGDFRKVGAEMTNIFYIVLGNLAGETQGEGGSSMKIESLLQLIPPSLRRDYGAEISKSFEIFQTLSFAPEEMLGSLRDASVLGVNVDQAKKIISQLIQSVVESEKK